VLDAGGLEVRQSEGVSAFQQPFLPRLFLELPSAVKHDNPPSDDGDAMAHINTIIYFLRSEPNIMQICT
jgi:hypothetical protein